MDLKTLANLALSKIGEPPIATLGDASSKSARLAALHLEPTLREVLRAHFWGFAMTVRPLAAQDVREYLGVTGNLKVGNTSLTIPPLYRKETDIFEKTYYEGALGASSYWNNFSDRWYLSSSEPASWGSSSDTSNVDTPDLCRFEPRHPAHALETNLAGPDNDIRFTQADQRRTPAAVHYLEPAHSARTVLSISGRTLTVTPATRARMIVSGASISGVNGILLLAGVHDSNWHWTSNGQSYEANLAGTAPFTVLYYYDNAWKCRRILPGTPATYDCQATSPADYPDGLDYDAPITGIGSCTVTAAGTSAGQIIDAIASEDPLCMSVYGELTDSAGRVLVFPALVHSGRSNNRPCYTRTGDIFTDGYAIFWDGAAWQMRAGHVTCFTSADDVASPDLCTAWTEVSPATGSPIAYITQGTLQPSDLLTAAIKPGNNGTGAVTAMPKASLSGGVTGVPTVRMIRPADELLGWKHAHLLPDGCLKVRELRDTATGRRIDKFTRRRVSGKNCVLSDHAAVSLEYVEYIPDPSQYDSDFIAAFTTLFAARLARAISGSDDLESKFLQIYETVALPAARTASGHETDSNENHPLRELLDGSLTPHRGDFLPRG